MKVTRPLMIGIAAALLLTLSPAAFARGDWRHGDGGRHEWRGAWRHDDPRRFGYVYPYSYDGEPYFYDAEPIYPYTQEPADVDPLPFQSPSADPPPFSPWVDPPPFLEPEQ
jgi:hypothetical protein